MENLSTFVRTLGNQFIRGKKVFVGAIGLDGKVLDGGNSSGTSGQVLSTTGSNVQWITVGSSNVEGINDLNDVTITSLASGDLLKYNGSEWVNFTHSFLTTSSELSDLNDVGNLNPSNNDILVYNNGSWVADEYPEEVDTLDDVTGRGNTTTNNISVGSITSTGNITTTTGNVTAVSVITPLVSYNGKITISSAHQLQQGESPYTFLAFNFGSTDVVTVDESGYVTSAGFKVSGSSGFLKADGTIDTNTYLTSYTESQDLDDVTDLGASTTNTITVGGVVSSEYSSTADIEITAYNAGGLTPQAGDPVDLISFIWNTTTLGVIDTDSNITFNGFKTPSGTSAGFLKADGSVDTTTYLSSAPSRDLDSLSNVSVPNPADEDFLVYDNNSSKWVNSSLSFATTSYVDTAVSNLVSSAPSTLDTLNELAAALGDDANFSTTVTNSIATKLPLAGGTLTGNLLLNDDVRAGFGDDSDLRIYHDASNSYITNATGEIFIKGADDLSIQDTDGTNRAIFQANAQKLYYDGSLKFETTSAGATVSGDLLLEEANTPMLKLLDTTNNLQGRFRVANNYAYLSVDNPDNVASSRLVFEVDGSTPLYLDHQSNATFAGDITFGDSHFIGDDGDDNLLIQGSAGENIIIDSADDIVLDAAANDIRFKVGGVEFGKIRNDSNNLSLYSSIQDENILFKGNDGGTTITALTLDMSDSGAAEFGARLYIPEYIAHVGDSNTLFGFSGNDTFIVNTSGTTALTINSSQNSTFAGQVNITSSGAAHFSITNTNVSGSSQQFLQYVGSNGDYVFRNATDSTSPLVLAKNNNATFAGNITLTPASGHPVFSSGSSKDLNINSGSGNVYFNNTGNTTFAGDARFNSRVRIGDVTGLSNRGTVRIDTRGDAPADLLFGRDTAGTATSWSGVYWSLSSRSSSDSNAFRIYRGTSHSSPYNSEAVLLQLNPDLSATFAGNVSAPEFDLPSGGMLDWANGDARIIEGLVNNYSLSFQTYDGSGVSTALRLDGNNNATFAGDVTINGNLNPEILEFYDINGTVTSRFKIYAWDNELQFTKRNISTGAYDGSILALDYSDDSATFAGSVNIGDGSADTRLVIKRLDGNNADDIQFYNGTTRVGEIGTKDTTWLRINQTTAKNIYTPRYIRADGGFFVDTTAKGINGSGNFIGGTITGASDANVSNWDTAYSWGNHASAGYLTGITASQVGSVVGKGQNNNYVASSTSTSNRGNYGQGVWAYSGYSSGSNRPFTYDATLQVMPTSGLGFELSTSWHSTDEGKLKIRALRDCCEGWGSYYDVWTSANFTPTDFLSSNSTDIATGKITFAANYSDANSVAGGGGVTPFKLGFQASNRPGSGNYFTGIEYTFSDTGARAQLGFGSDGNNNIPRLYARTEGWGGNNGWHSWYQIWHSGNDGSGSGLDADTVDGKHKDFLMHYKGVVSGNWDTIFSQTDGHMGVYEVQNISNTDTNFPTGSYTYGGVLSWQLDNSTFKLYAPHTGTLWYQTGWNNDEYSGWRKIWDNNNDGAGSGLDADLLDGQQGSYYATAAHTQSASTITTGTFTAGIYRFRYDNGITGSSVPAYTNAGVEILTGGNSTPTVSFHRGGYSATALYEYDGQLYVKPWTTRAQEGLLLSTGNIGSYVVPLSGGAMTGNLHLTDPTTAGTSSKVQFGTSTSWNNNIGIESYWMVFGCNQNEGFKFEDSTGNMLLQLNGANSSSGNGQLSATFAGNVTLNSRLTFDYGGDHYLEAGTNSLSYKSSSGSSIMSLNASTSTATFSNANITSKFAVGIANVHASFDFYNQGTAYFNGATTIDDNLSMNGSINFGSSNGYVNLSRGGFITFYENNDGHHGIGSRSNTGGEADDLRINSYGAVYVNLDSNSNNTSGADFMIGRHGQAAGTISELFRVSGENGNLNLIPGAKITGNTALSRDKIRVWSDSNYTIGMTNGFTFGSIGNSGSEYAMTFQMNNNSNRGFWWGDTGHSGSQGAMSLTTNGKLTVAGSMVVSAGEGNTVGPVFNNQFSLKNYTTVITDTFHTGQSTQAKRYEIARVFFDYNDWGNTGVLEIELMEPYFGQGVSKKYQLVAGYNNYADMDLVEISGGSQTESFQLTVGSLTTVSGDIRYLPIYAEVRFYSQCEAKITTNRDLTTNSLSTTKGAIYINTSPTGTNISDPTIVDNVQTNQSADTINLGTSAKVGIGISNGSTPSYPLHVNSNVSNVSIYASADITAFSDARVKDNIMTISNPLDKIKAIRGVTYERTDLESDKRSMGVIAQEVLPHVPEVVHEDEKGMYSVSYQNMVALLIEGMKEQQKEIDELKSMLKK